MKLICSLTSMLLMLYLGAGNLRGQQIPTSSQVIEVSSKVISSFGVSVQSEVSVNISTAKETNEKTYRKEMFVVYSDSNPIHFEIRGHTFPTSQSGQVSKSQLFAKESNRTGAMLVLSGSLSERYAIPANYYGKIIVDIHYL